MITTTGILIRQLAWQEADLRQILAIERSSFNPFDAYSRDDFERWLHYNPDLCLAAEIDGRIAGYVITRILSGVGDLASLAIHPAYRRRGVGSALLAATQQRLQKYGVSEITLEVRQTNPAGLAFWQNMGFVPFGILPRFYEDGEDAIRMRKVLTGPA